MVGGRETSWGSLAPDAVSQLTKEEVTEGTP